MRDSLYGKGAVAACGELGTAYICTDAAFAEGGISRPRPLSPALGSAAESGDNDSGLWGGLGR